MDYREIDLVKTWVLQGTLNFTRYFFKQRFKRKFVVGQHHVEIAKALDKVFSGECTRLIINIAPRYGKTELAVKNFIAMGLAINPQAKFIHLSYSDDLARDNSRGVQEILRDPSYRRLFPGTMPTSVNTHKWFTSAGGGLYAVSSAGQVTGFGAGIVDKEEEEALTDAVEELESINDGTFGGAIVIDDPVKPDDAQSELVREKVNQKFETTIRNRANSRKTPIIIIMQRLHEHDLCGYLQEIEPDEWTVVSLPVIQHDEYGEEQALWPFKHTLEDLYKIRNASEFVFETQYMQKPTPMEGLMYRDFRLYDDLPDRDKAWMIGNYTDSADTGADFLCSICFDAHDDGYYVTDVLYTKKPMEYTEPTQANMLKRNGTDVCFIESNNGGRSFARNVEAETRKIGNRKTAFVTFAQRKNKQVRLFTRSNEVSNMLVFPSDWDVRWPDFYHDLKYFRKEGYSAHDDAPDAATGIIEKCEEWHNNMTDEQLLRDFY